jgi:hypothetical protein
MASTVHVNFKLPIMRLIVQFVPVGLDSNVSLAFGNGE